MTKHARELQPAGLPELALDDRHALVRVDHSEWVSAWPGAAPDSTGWLLFRAGSTAAPRGAGGPPRLSREQGGVAVHALLREAAGWDRAVGAAVALFELAGLAGGEPELDWTSDSAWVLEIDGGQLRVPLRVRRKADLRSDAAGGQ
ncbi:MAG: hypothetical protein ACREN1_08305 [Candidatus Dormibacteria bacterium]